MLVPSKFTRLEESTIFKMRCILSDRKENESVLDVYVRTKDFFYDASEFLHALDILYVLGAVNINEDSELIKYA
ncbi:ABC-three component system middle component 7 [Undibacterium amnicola]|uniref:ABC-three component system middle component 7 n=1 Tax=Undibacterium amnicola TaxID=1834038 RepID=UPI0036107D49